MQDSVYHVLLEGRKVGPYDRRTIVGMRIRKALGSDDVVVGADGRQLTVRDLVRKPGADTDFQPNRSGSYSVVQGIYAAALEEVKGDACCAVPPYAGELEVRVQTKVLRIEGRWRDGRAWKQERLKIPLEQVVHAAVRGGLVDLGLRPAPGAHVQRLTLDLLSPEAAGEFAGSLPHVSAWPANPVATKAKPAAPRQGNLMAWAGAAGVTVLVTIVVVVVWVLTHRG